MQKTDNELNGMRWSELTKEESARVAHLIEIDRARLISSKGGWLLVQLINR